MLWVLWQKKKIEHYCATNSFIFLKNFTLHNIYYLFYVNSYKGYRHLFGLPTRGQRTWSNARTARKLNTMLIRYKERKLVKFLNNKQFKPFIFLSEYINYFYKYNWHHEWLFNKYHLRKLRRSTRYVKPKFYAIHIKYQKITSFAQNILKRKVKVKHNKRKVKTDNKSFSIGFRFGYLVKYTKFFKIVYQLK